VPALRLGPAPRLLDRLATGLSLAMLITLGLFSIHLAQQAERQRSRPAAPAPGPREPDYFVERLALLTLDPQGAPQWRLQALALRHFPADDSARFESPRLVNLGADRPTSRLRADSGLWYNQQMRPDGQIAREQRIELSGQVEVERAALPGRAALRVHTQQATVLPDLEQVHSDRPVVIREAGHQLEGTGFELDLRQRSLRLDSRVKAVWQPQAAAESAGSSR